MHDAQLRGALNKLRLRLENRRKAVVEIRRYLAEIAAVGRLRRQPQRDAGLVNLGQGLDELRASRRQLRLPRIVLLAGYIGPADERPRPIELKLRQRQRGLAFVDTGDPRMQQSDLVVDVLHRVLQVPAPAQCQCLDRAHRRGGGLQVRRRDVDRGLLFGDRDLVRLLIQRGEEIAFVHTVVVIHQNAGNLACYAGCYKRHVPIDECVVRGGGVEHRPDPRNAEHEKSQGSNSDRPGENFSLPRSLSGVLRHRGRFRRRLRGFRVVGSRSIAIRWRLCIDRSWGVTLLCHIGHPLQGDQKDECLQHLPASRAGIPWPVTRGARPSGPLP